MKEAYDIYIEEVIPAINKLILTSRAHLSYPKYIEDETTIEGYENIYIKECNSYLSLINIHFENICQTYKNVDRETLNHFNLYYNNNKTDHPFAETNIILNDINEKLTLINKS